MERANQLDLFDCKATAIDASKLKSYQRAIPKYHIDKTILIPNMRAKFDRFKKKITWFSWKVHFAAAAIFKFILAITVTLKNEAYCNQALTLIQRLSELLTDIKCELLKYWIMDLVYDYNQIYKNIFFDYNG
ncbi:MAG: hypothetical protein K9K32_03645 [Halanaerobiales bacterium]|nr:hypothetical protein [Halanaerobiales bacterium]